MAAVPVVIHAMLYPRDKSGDPYPVTLAGFANIAGLEVGGGPIIPPGEVPPEKPPGDPSTIWPPDRWLDAPEHPIVIPDPPTPPVDPPTTPVPPHNGWNWSAAKGGWYFLYVPGTGAPTPKRKA